MMRRYGSVILQEISIDSLSFNALNLRGLLRSEEQIIRTARSIFEVGVIHPPVVAYTPKGVLAVAGEARLLAHLYLVNQGLSQFSRVLCKVLEGVDERVAMKILAEENFAHGTIVPAATANEVYWHYAVDLQTSKNPETALNKVMGIWKNNPYIYNFLILPGWLIYHSPTVSRLIEEVGPRREGLNKPTVRKIASKIRQVRLSWWRIISAPYKPLNPFELMNPPRQEAAQDFDGLMKKTFALLDEKVRGESAILELEKIALPVKYERLIRSYEEIKKAIQIEGGIISPAKKERLEKVRRELVLAENAMKKRKIAIP